MPFDHNDHYHRALERYVPHQARRALDVGCGSGALAARLARRGLAVDGLDSDAGMVSAARERCAALPPGTPEPCFRVADVRRTPLPAGHYDVVTALASLHHVPFATVSALRAALAPGGVLLVLGCYRSVTPVDAAWSLAAVPVNAAARAAVALRGRGRPAPPPPPVQAPATPLAQVRREAAELLPGSRVRRLLFWRYLLVYRAPGGGPGSAGSAAPHGR